ncbi:MAG: GatB/YqeY domain-containing protein [Candidatus Spechtbacteria bacterium]|nr:GatB/YqeY domain-containing protein [Candidatus Spechtbacteria bacterium]
MGNLQTRINSDLVTAMKAGDEVAKSVLRMLRAEITRKEIELMKRELGLDDAEVVALVAKEIKKRQEAIELYAKGGRQDLVDQEQKELKVLEMYRPAQLSDEDVKQVISRVMMEAQGVKDVGLIMKKVMEQIRGQADGARVRILVEEIVKFSL